MTFLTGKLIFEECVKRNNKKTGECILKAKRVTLDRKAGTCVLHYKKAIDAEEMKNEIDKAEEVFNFLCEKTIKISTDHDES